MSVPQASDLWKVYVVLKMVKLDPAMKTVSNFFSPNFVGFNTNVIHCRIWDHCKTVSCDVIYQNNNSDAAGGTTLISWVQTLLRAILSTIFSLADDLLECTGDHHFRLTIATLNWWLPLRTWYCQFELAITTLNWGVPLWTRDCHFELEVANCQFIVALASSKLLNAISRKVFIAWPSMGTVLRGSF